jgi:hypothetical protein
LKWIEDAGAEIELLQKETSVLSAARHGRRRRGGRLPGPSELSRRSAV